jgi:hypothetical protein
MGQPLTNMPDLAIIESSSNLIVQNPLLPITELSLHFPVDDASGITPDWREGGDASRPRGRFARSQPTGPIRLLSTLGTRVRQGWLLMPSATCTPATLRGIRLPVVSTG